MTRPDLEDQDLALNLSSVEVHAAGVKVCKMLCGSIPHALRIHTVGHHITLTLAITWLFVFAFNERNNHSKLESSHSSRSLSEGQDALHLLTEGVFKGYVSLFSKRLKISETIFFASYAPELRASQGGFQVTHCSCAAFAMVLLPV